MKKTFFSSLASFVKQEILLCVCIVAALCSCFFIPPSFKYLSYIDWNTLTLLFSLMAVMKGLQKAGLFSFCANALLKKTKSSRLLFLLFVFFPFITSMLVTNDVALITFVPFGMLIFTYAQQEKHIVSLVIWQTIAANLGSMLTPMGNPQNLYLYNRSGLSFGAFCKITLPYVLLAALFCALPAFVKKSERILPVSVQADAPKAKTLLVHGIGFALCLLSVFKLVPAPVTAVIIGVFLLFYDRDILKRVDYSLLGTFFALFIFIGNISRIPAFRDFITSLLQNNVEFVSAGLSQIISNVPAALLLAGFTDHWKELIIGCNLGGLGTLIASMASLISYKFLIKEYPQKKGRYFLRFTLANFSLLAVLMAFHFLLVK